MTRLLPAGQLLDSSPPNVSSPARGSTVSRSAKAVERPSVSLVLSTLVVTVEVAAVWLAPFNSQDGPAHARAAAALGRELTGRSGGNGSLFAPNLGLQPNWITYPPFVALADTAGARSAELVIVTMLIISVVAAGRYAASSFGPKGTAVSLLILPFSMSWYLHIGLYNYVASLAVLLVVVGYWIRMPFAPGAREGVVSSLLLLALYFSHPLSLLAGLAFVGTLAFFSGRGWRRRCLIVVAASTPALLLCAFHLGDGPDQVLRWRSAAAVTRGTALFRYPLESLTRAERPIATIFAAVTLATTVLVIAVRVHRRRLDRWDALLIVAAGSVLGAVAVPDRFAGGNLIQPRMAIYPVVALTLWLAAQAAAGRMPRWLVAVAGGVAVVAALALVTVRIGPYQDIEAQLTEIRSAGASLATMDTFVPVVSRAAPRMVRTGPLLHSHNWLAVETDAVGVVNLDAGTGYGPVVYRDGIDPKSALRGLGVDGTSRASAEKIITAIERYQRRSARRIDAVVLIGFDQATSPAPELVAAGFEPVGSTESTGLAVVLRVGR